MKSEKTIPEQIDVQVTGRCNAKCGMCIQEITYKAPEIEEAFKKGVKKHLSAFYDFGGRKLIITGGEPTLAPVRVEHTLNVAHSLGSWDLIAMYTNGSRLNREMTERLKGAGLQYVDLSVHHYDPIRNGRIFGLPYIDASKVSTNMGEAGLPFRYCATIQKGGIESIGDVFQYLKFAQENGARDVYFRELFKVDRSSVEHPERVDYIDENFVSLDTILQDLTNKKIIPIQRKADFQGREKSELEYRTQEGFPFYFSRLQIGGERKEELPYLVVMPNGQLHSTWHGKGDYIEDLKSYGRRFND